MRDNVKPETPRFENFTSPGLSPADGLDSASTLFTAPPIESLEILKELGDIAAASLREIEAALSPPVVETAPSPVTAPAVPTPSTAQPLKAPHSDATLVDALLEYHRLRGPKLGARTAPRPSGNPSETRDRFSAVEIPVIQDFVPKPSTARVTSSRPVQTILKPKPRS